MSRWSSLERIKDWSLQQEIKTVQHVDTTAGGPICFSRASKKTPEGVTVGKIFVGGACNVRRKWQELQTSLISSVNLP